MAGNLANARLDAAATTLAMVSLTAAIISDVWQAWGEGWDRGGGGGYRDQKPVYLV